MAREYVVLVQAIIVDAFFEVKESTCASVSIFDDLTHTLRARAADARALASSVFWWRPRTSLTTTETGQLLKYACTCTAACSGDAQTHLHTQPSQLEQQTSTSLGGEKRVLQLGAAKLTRQDVAEVLSMQQRNLEAAWRAKVGAGLGGSMQQDLEKLSYWIFERFSEEDQAHNSECKFEELERTEGAAESASGQDVRLPALSPLQTPTVRNAQCLVPVCSGMGHSQIEQLHQHRQVLPGTSYSHIFALVLCRKSYRSSCEN